MIDIKARLILKKEDQVLLCIQRTAKGRKFTLAGGRIEGMEYAREALIREAFEEIGIKLKKQDLKLVHVLHKKNKKGNVVTFYFKSSHWEGMIKNKEPQNFYGVEWHLIGQLPGRTSPTTKHVINKVLQGKIYSELKRE